MKNKNNKINEAKEDKKMINTSVEIGRAFSTFIIALNYPPYYELEHYGITPEDYKHPTVDSLRKLKEYALDQKYRKKTR